MANYHEYDDLFASYERRTNTNKPDSSNLSTDNTKSVGYTSSSSYKKNQTSASHNALDSVKNKAGSIVKSAKEKVPKNKTPEKSQKKYYGNASYEPESGSRTKKSAQDDSSATVRFNYNSTKKSNQSTSK